MRTFLIWIAALIIYAACMEVWYTQYFAGSQWNHLPFVVNILTASLPITLGILLVWLAKSLSNTLDRILPSVMVLVTIGFVNQSCSDKAKANMKTLYTSDCGVTWEAIKPGESIPKCRVGYCGCSYSLTIPDYPMQGGARFKAMFAEKVLAWIEADYDYEIFDGELFVKEAKYLGKMGSSADDSSNSNKGFEQAENMVIDKRIKEALMNFSKDEDIVDFDPSMLEDLVLAKTNELLAKKGVRLNFLTLVPEFDEQTRTAIDAATAMRIYNSKHMDSLGALIMSAKAGATKIIIHTESQETPETSE